MHIGQLDFSLVSLAICAAGLLMLHRFWSSRYHSVRRELARVSEDLSQLVDLQTQLHGRLCRTIEDVESRILDLAVPSPESPLPLQRRHQVLALASKGTSVDEIARRLNMPKGEAELIVSLRKYAEAKPPAEAANGNMRAYARA